MTKSAEVPPPLAWETLAPWEKAAQWQSAAPHIATEVMVLAKQWAEHRWQMERDNASHIRAMDKRRWILQVFTLATSVVNVAVLSIVAWRYADAGSLIPGLVTFGAGTGLTAGAYVAGRALQDRRMGQTSQAKPSEDGIPGTV